MERLTERIADHGRAQRAARRQHFEQTMARLAGEIEGLPSMQARVDRSMAIQDARLAALFGGLDPLAAEAHVAAVEAARRAHRAEDALRALREQQSNAALALAAAEEGDRRDPRWPAAVPGAIRSRSRSRSRSRPPP
jgi:4'-phosphopantetheinyl transferase EntD